MESYTLKIAGQNIDIPGEQLLNTLMSAQLVISSESGESIYPLFSNAEQIFDKETLKYVIFLAPNNAKIII